MARWLCLDLARQPLGPPFEAPDRPAAEALARRDFGASGWTVVSYLSYQVELEEAAALQRLKLRQAG